MNTLARNSQYLDAEALAPQIMRPLIGVPTGRERSARMHGLPLYIMNQTYVRVLEEMGALPVLIPLGMSEATLRGTFERLDGLFLPGGEDIEPRHYDEAPHAKLGVTDSERDRTEMLLTRWAIERKMPLLAVCRGMQVLNVVCGGSLYQDLRSQRPELSQHDFTPPTYQRYRICHNIAIAPDSLLASALGRQHVINSMHHQAVKSVGMGLRVVATDEQGMVEALEMADAPFVVGVQWHPEELARTDEYHARLFRHFVLAAASDWRTNPRAADGGLDLAPLAGHLDGHLSAQLSAHRDGVDGQIGQQLEM